MKMICWECFNYTYFEADVETLKELKTGKDGMIIQDSMFDDYNYSQGMLRDNLIDVVQYCINQNADVLDHNLENRYLTCARCGSKKVTKPYSSWTSRRHLPIEQEIHKNHQEYKELRKERLHADQLPVLWKSK